MYIPKYFEIHELVPKNLYESFGAHSELLWATFDDDLLKGIDWLRARYGSTTINNYAYGHGNYEWSGLRLNVPECSFYSEGSMHSVGKAADLKFKECTAEEVRQDLKRIKVVPWITRLEDKVDWLHVDTKPTGQDEIYLFNP